MDGAPCHDVTPSPLPRSPSPQFYTVLPSSRAGNMKFTRMMANFPYTPLDSAVQGYVERVAAFKNLLIPVLIIFDRIPTFLRRALEKLLLKIKNLLSSVIHSLTGHALLLQVAQAHDNAFIQEQVNIALESMVKNCSAGRVLTALVETKVRQSLTRSSIYTSTIHMMAPLRHITDFRLLTGASHSANRPCIIRETLGVQLVFAPVQVTASCPSVTSLNSPRRTDGGKNLARFFEMDYQEVLWNAVTRCLSFLPAAERILHSWSAPRSNFLSKEAKQRNKVLWWICSPESSKSLSLRRA
ncbi:uncharacterized protein V6R79_001588 [Siganus canaliculatus]